MPAHEAPSPSVQDDSYFRRVRTEIAPFLPAAIGRVLEIGCGAGGTMAWLRSTRSVGYAAGVELCPAAASVARAGFDAIEIADIRSAALEFGAGTFDVVLALDVLEHLADPWEVLRRLAAVMAPDGVLIASIPNVAHYKVAWPLLVRGQWTYTDEGLLDRTHLRFFTRATAISLFEDTGFTVQARGANVEFPHVLGLLGLSGRRWRWYSQAVMRRLLPWPGRWFTVQFLIAARLDPVSNQRGAGGHRPLPGQGPSPCGCGQGPRSIPAPAGITCPPGDRQQPRS